MSSTEQINVGVELEQLVRAEHSDPFHVLGPHAVEAGGKKQMAIRTFQPRAEGVTVTFTAG